LSATLEGYVCLHGRRYVALAFAPHRYPHQSRRRNLAVNRTLQILDWLQDSALHRRKKMAFILFMIDATKRFAKDLLEHCHNPETPCFQGGGALVADDGHAPGLHTEEGIARRCQVF
jgi:hypothetical protein